MGYMGYRSRGGAFEVKVIRVQLLLYYLSALGNVGTTKAVLSESSDDSNQALSMAIPHLILGPSIWCYIRSYWGITSTVGYGSFM